MTDRRAQPLSPDRIEYLELRARTDCILAWQVGDHLLCYGQDAAKVAEVCGLELTERGRDAKGNPVPCTEIPGFFSYVGTELNVAIYAQCFNAIMDAGLPLALAVERQDQDGQRFREIVCEWRPQTGRPVLRVVKG